MRGRAPLVVGVAVVSLAACDFTFQGSDDATTDDEIEADAAPATLVTTPPTPFCAAVDELERRIDESSGDDDRPAIVEAYTAMLDLVPADVRPDFEAVLATLRQGGESTVPTTAPLASVDLDAPTGPDATPTTRPPGSTLPPESSLPATVVFEEGYDPEATPAGRIGAYIDFACDRAENNPGPSPTQPDAPAPGTTAAS
jgi:hypothetical protein